MDKKSGDDLDLVLSQIKEREDDFMQLIRQRLGIIIHRHQASELEKVIFQGCKKFKCSTDDYLKTLASCQFDAPLLEHLVYGITVGETYFFRDNNQIRLLKEFLLPEIIKMKRAAGDLSLRFWSAGCASGEEIYTLAMMISELIPDRDAWMFQLMGTDINTNSMKKAINGCYGEWSMRVIPRYYKEKYFTRDNNNYLISEDIRKMVSFSYLNLNGEGYPSILNGTNAQDLIMCCNVLIYFDNERIATVMKNMASCLVPTGYLLLGASDPVVLTSTDLVLHRQNSAYFARALASTPTVVKTAAPLPKPSQPLFAPVTVAVAKKTDISKPVLAINQALLAQLLTEAKWQVALDLISTSDLKEAKTPVILSAKATVLANLGKLEQAAEVCQEYFKIDPINKHIYFTYALILSELNQLERAEEFLRKALFLDRHFVEGHFQLGLLLIRNKKQEAGLKSLRNALAMVKSKDPTQPVSELRGLNFGQLAQILEHEIALYGTPEDVNHERKKNDVES